MGLLAWIINTRKRRENEMSFRVAIVFLLLFWDVTFLVVVRQRFLVLPDDDA